MFRLLLIGLKDTFYSPFVYTKLQAENRLWSHNWLVKKGCTLKIVEIFSCPRKAFWKPEYDRALYGTKLDAKIRSLDMDWRSHDWTEAHKKETFMKGLEGGV